MAVSTGSNGPLLGGKTRRRRGRKQTHKRRRGGWRWPWQSEEVPVQGAVAPSLPKQTYDEEKVTGTELKPVSFGDQKIFPNQPGGKSRKRRRNRR
jgi:hypothetical protein